MRLLSFFCVAMGIVFISCRSQKQLPYNYIENVTDTAGKDAVKNFEPIIQKNDLLSIQVYSNSTKPEVSDIIYNPPALNNSTSGSTGYLVDLEGNIKFPRIGVIRAEGLTKKQLADSIASRITDLESPTVIIRFLNYRITVLGEVGHQGTFTIPYERVTIFEALGLAGDIPLTGKKESVRVIREINGNREIGTVNLTSKNVFDSPYYNLQQNDVVIVDVKSSKVRQTDQALVTQRITFALSLVTSIALLYNIFR
jgi:polysaccharide export outer membrane protein